MECSVGGRKAFRGTQQQLCPSSTPRTYKDLIERLDLEENERKPAQIQTRDGQTEYKKLAHHKDNHGLEQGLKVVQSPALNR